MHAETFSESYSGHGGYFRHIDARAKLVFTGLCLALAVVSESPVAPLTVGAVCLSLLLISGAPVRAVLLRMAEPMVFALLLAAFQAFLTPGEPVLSLGVLGAALSVSSTGLAKGALILSRVTGAVTAVLFLTMTTPAHRLLSAAARLRAPKALVEVSLFAYRFVFVLMEDAVTIYQAQRGRLGYSRVGIGVRSLATLAGSVFLRAFSRAEAAGESMVLRGYTGKYVPSFAEDFRARDGLLLAALFSFCLAVKIWTS